MGHGWGKKLAQNNSKPMKVVIRLALMLWFAPSSNSLHLATTSYGGLY